MPHTRNEALEVLRQDYEKSARGELTSMGVLKPGQTFELVFKIGGSPYSLNLLIAVQNQRPVTPEQRALLELRFDEYFNRGRCIEALGNNSGITRLVNAMKNEVYTFQERHPQLTREQFTLRWFLEQVTAWDMGQWPNVGRVTVGLVERILLRDGFPLRKG